MIWFDIFTFKMRIKIRNISYYISSIKYEIYLFQCGKRCLISYWKSFHYQFPRWDINYPTSKLIYILLYQYIISENKNNNHKECQKV
jgi:hypothetical protein